MSNAAILIVGDLFSREMAPLCGCIESLSRAGCDVRFAGRDDSRDWQPHLVVVCQEWSDQFTAGDVRQLITSYPLSRICCCATAWCESDGRTRDIWPAAVRVPIRSAPERIRRELEVIAGLRRGLALTASRNEIFHLRARPPAPDRPYEPRTQ